MMPRLDGFGLVREVRADPALADIPIVLLSARAGEESTIEGRQAGADDYLVKPFSARELLARIAANLKMSKLRHNFEQRIAADLRAMTLLREVGSQCMREDVDMEQCLHQIVDAAIAITGADKGNLQLFEADVGAFTIAAQRGFDGPILKLFEQERETGSAYAAATRMGTRVIIEDVTRSDLFAATQARQAMVDAGVRAVISTPLMNSKGSLLGVISTHFASPRRPGERELHFMDLLARQTAYYLERSSNRY